MNPNPSGLLLINKPKGITSFTIIRALRNKTGISKIGHGGTLDKNAHGLVLIGIGEGTKLLTQALMWEKTYVFQMVLGVGSDTYDWVGHKWRFCAVPTTVNETNLRNLLLTKFTGTIQQQPPIYSALKKNGKEYYRYALENKEFDIPSREVTLYETSLASFMRKNYQAEAIITVRCSKGTYIRSLARDIGEYFQTEGVIKELCRTSIGKYSLSQSVSLEQINSEADLKKYLLP